MDATQIFGKQGLNLEAAGEIVISQTGLWTGSCRFTFPRGHWDLVPRNRSPHPLCGFLLSENSRVIFTPGLWTVLVEYAGVEKDSEPTYELVPGVGTEPIETHKDFVGVLAGKPSAPLNGAIFKDIKNGHPTKSDELGKYEFDRFAEFIGEPAAANEMAGVRSFFEPNNTVWVKRWTSKNQPPATNCMKIVSSPDGPCPAFPSGYNWLEHPIATSGRGGAWANEQRWMLSGRKGWISMIYPS